MRTSLVVTSLADRIQGSSREVGREEFRRVSEQANGKTGIALQAALRLTALLVTELRERKVNLWDE